MTSRMMPLKSVTVVENNLIEKFRVMSLTQDTSTIPTNADNTNNAKQWTAPAPVSNIIDSDEKSDWWKEKNSGVKVFITKDPELLKQYYAMRHEVYCVENGWSNYHSAENELDHKGKIIVAVKDNKVVGGMRLLTSRWVEYFPNEVPGTEFTYRNFLKKFGLDENAVISEISAFFVEKNHRDSTISTMMLEHAFEEAKAQNCIYNVGISTPLLNRSHRKDIKRLGYKVEIYNHPWKPQKSQNYVASCPIVIFLTEYLK